MDFNRKIYYTIFLLPVFIFPSKAFSQVRWTNVDTAFGALPVSVHVYKTSDSVNGFAGLVSLPYQPIAPALTIALTELVLLFSASMIRRLLSVRLFLISFL